VNDGLADGDAEAGELCGDLEDGEVLLAAELQDGAIALDGVWGGLAGLAAGSGGQEEVAIGMLVEVAGELQEVGGGIVEAPSGIWQGESVNAEGAEGFVLAVVRVAVLEEDGGEVGEEQPG